MRNCRRKIDEVDAKLMTWHHDDECNRRLVKIPGVGPIGAMLLKMKTPEPELFRSGRQFAAWIGLTPTDHSTAGKVRLGVITRAGDEGLRSVLVVGATAVIQHGRRGGRASRWLVSRRCAPSCWPVPRRPTSAICGYGRKLRREVRVGRRRLEISQTRGAT